MVVSLSNFTYSVCNHCMAMYDDNSDDVVDNSDDSTATATVTIRTIIISTTASITTYATTISFARYVPGLKDEPWMDGWMD
jgi:hypothetical protein